MSQRLQLAKLTRPQLYQTVSRERLHSQFDLLRENYPVLWVTGPPGAGKTTCVSNYVQVRKLPGIWYQLDNNDTDLASFFYHMKMAAQVTTKAKSMELPLLTAEYLPDLAGFSRLFFRKFFSIYSKSAVFVLDNYHHLAAGSALHTAIDVAISELPPSHTLIVISRMSPPPVLARALANHCIGKIQWGDLRLTVEEIAAIAATAGLTQLPEEVILTLENQSDGWVAGVMLMIEGIKHERDLNPSYLIDNKEVIFNYFASQVFEHLRSDRQEFLLRTAVLPEITIPAALLLSKNEESQQQLDYLYRRRLFINRRNSGNQFYYQYHILFREFLLARAKIHFTEYELKQLQKTAAGIAEKNGELLAATDLLSEAHAWEALYELIVQQAALLMHQGRTQTLQEIIAYFPAQMIPHKPWLLYWRGVSCLITNPDQARQNLEEAFIGFQQISDVSGQLLSCGEIFDAYNYSENDIRPVIQWADQLQDLLNLHGRPSIDIEVALLTKLQGLMFAAPHHPLFEFFEKKLKTVFASEILPFQKLAIASTFIFLSLWRGEAHKTLWLFKEASLLFASEKEIPPLFRILWLNVESAFAWSTTAEHDISDQKFQQALLIAKDNKISLFNSMLIGHGVYGSLAAGDTKQARKYLELMKEHLSASRKHEITQFYFLSAGVDFLEGNTTKALHHATLALELYEELGRPFLIEATRASIAQILIEHDDFTTAYLYLEKTIQYTRIMRSRLLESQCLITESYGRIKQGNINQALIVLREGLKIAQQNDLLYLNTWWRPHMMAEIFHLALEHEIEVDFVKTVIHHRNIKATFNATETWPWIIKIFTLGHFEILSYDKIYQPQGKSQQKPLELLKFLCAYEGKPVLQDIVMDALWPSHDNETARQNLATTLHRLRKLLACDKAIILQDKYLSLDLGYVWVDCINFKNQSIKIQIMRQQDLENILNLYKGNFLEGEMAFWAIAFRDQLKARHIKVIEHLGNILEANHMWKKAVDNYSRAINFHPVSEILYRKLMNSHIHLGQRDQALATYQLCRKKMLTHLRISPSLEIQHIYNDLCKSIS